ncbi:MAG: ABC transporter permease [Lachnospiraceae bacterium]|nr:ABC transporter permease [Lachnospiraceae bacterium]
MAGKSGRSIKAEEKLTAKKLLFTWEGALILLFIAVNIFNMSISQSYTFANVLREMPKFLAEMFMVLPMAYILVLGDIDISVGSIVCLTGTLTCYISNAGAPFPVVILGCLGAGLLCGAFNGFVTTSFPELPSMITTLGSQIIFRGIAEIYLGGGGSVSYTNTKQIMPLSTKLGKTVPVIILVVILAAVIFTVILQRTTFGRSLYAIGSNKVSAFYAGVDVKRCRFIAYVLMGFMAGMCGLFLTAYTYGANTTTGQGFEMEVIAMCVFGGIASTGGKGTLVGGIIAGLIITLLRIALGQANVNSQMILVIVGALLIIAVLIPGIKGRIDEMRKLKAAA